MVSQSSSCPSKIQPVLDCIGTSVCEYILTNSMQKFQIYAVLRYADQRFATPPYFTERRRKYVYDVHYVASRARLGGKWCSRELQGLQSPQNALGLSHLREIVARRHPPYSSRYKIAYEDINDVSM